MAYIPKSKRTQSSIPQARPVFVKTNGNGIPMPPDSMALAHWCGVKHHILWHFILSRRKMYKIYRIPKPKGGVRILHAPNDKLKYAQRMFLFRVLSKFPTFPHIGAYTGARGVRYTAARHSGQAVVLELDIKDFFGNTTRKFVRDFFKGQGWPSQPAHLAADLLTYPVKDNLSIVPQGAPSSPTLCNLIGHERFDKQIIAYLANLDKDWLYTRYSDNLVISHPKDQPKTTVNAILANVRAIVRRGGYFVHPKKTKVMRATHPKRPQRLLGLTINRTPNIPIEEYKRLRAQVHHAKCKGMASVTGIPSGAGAAAHIDGRLNYFLHINPASRKLRKLKDEFDAVKQAEALKPRNLGSGSRAKSA